MAIAYKAWPPNLDSAYSVHRRVIGRLFKMGPDAADSCAGIVDPETVLDPIRER